MSIYQPMLPTPPSQQLSKAERQLCQIYKKLNDGKRETLLSFADFLISQQINSKEINKVEPVLQQPRLTTAEKNESVINGIKRLKSSYFMIDDQDLFHEISALMSAHIMKGVSAKETILKIEGVFEKFYNKYKIDFANKNTN